MALRDTITVIAKLAELRAIDRYAITGAVAALNYIQPTLTEDLDVLVAVAHLEKHRSGLLLLTPIERTLADMGYIERSDLGYMIDGWPVQFIRSLRSWMKRLWKMRWMSRSTRPAPHR